MTEDQIEEYYREGYIVMRGIARPHVIDDVLAVSPTDCAQGAAWTASIFKHDDPTESATLHQLLVEPGIVDAVESIFESPVRVYYGMLAVVAASSGKGLPWHQDNMYTHLAGRALNVFVALGDIPPQMACLWVAPRSHLLGLWPHHNSDAFGGHRESDQDPDNGIPLPDLQKGDACIFSRYTLHRSLQNETTQHRYAYAAQYMEDTAREYETGQKDPSKMRVSELREIWKQAD